MLFPARASHLAVSLAMSIYMVTIMAFVLTVVNTGIDGDFLARWWRAMYIAWPVAFVLLQLGGPWVRQLAMKLVKPS